MSNADNPLPQPQFESVEGGLHAPPQLGFFGAVGWWLHFILVVQLARLRFVLILLVVGVVLMKWDWLMAHYERWTQGSAPRASQANGDSEFFCPMHPTVVRDDDREKCPICFMPLSKRKRVPAEPLPPGVVNRVQLSPYRVALAGVGTWRVDYVPLSKQITTVGFVEFNERGLKNVSARVKGRLDDLFVNETGQRVKEGDELASLYSPELVVTMQNLIDARASKNNSLYRSAAERLKLWGVAEDQIEQIAQAGKAESHLKIRSPITGHVIKKYVREGQYVDEGTPLYDVADLSTVWIQAQVYEDDISFLPGHGDQTKRPESERLRATATTRAYPSEPFRGTLTFIHPHVDPNTRTLTVRFELENSEHRLRPGMTASVVLEIPSSQIRSMLVAQAEKHHSERKRREDSESATQSPIVTDAGVLAVPESAVIDTGARRIVYREDRPGVFEGIEVQLGTRLERRDGAVFFPVLAGLRPGERVVASGSFLVDAETRLNPAAGSIYFGGSTGSGKSGGSVTTTRPSTPDESNPFETEIGKLKAADQRLARAQRMCVVLTDNPLGSMGKPIKLLVEGEPVFLCCDGCREDALADPRKTLQSARNLRTTAEASKKSEPLDHRIHKKEESK